MSVAGDYIGRVRLGVTIGVAGSQSFVWPDGRPAGAYTADGGADGSIELTVTETGDDGLTVAWAADASRRMIGHPWRLLRDGAWLFGDLYVFEAEPTDQDPAEYTVIDGTVEVRVAMVAPAGDTGGAQLDVANTWTALQTFYSTLPHTPFADIGTTEPTVMIVADDEHGELASFFGAAIDFDGTIIVSSGMRVTERDTDGEPTGRFSYSIYNSLDGAWANVLAEGPTIGDIAAAVNLPHAVGTPTNGVHAATKAYVDAIETALSTETGLRATLVALTAEATDRANADAALGARIDTVTSERAAIDRATGATISDDRPKLALHTLLNLGDHAAGAYSTPHIGDLTGGFWLRFTANVQPYRTPYVSGPEDELYSEIVTIPHDDLGIWDNVEAAIERQWDADARVWRSYLFLEWTEIGDTVESQQVSTQRDYTTDGVDYPVHEITEGVEQEWAIWLDFENGDGVWELKFLRRTFDADPDDTVDGAEWERITHVLGDAPTSVDTGVTAYDWLVGAGPGRVLYGDITLRDGGPAGTVLLNPTGALAAAAGEGEPFTDGAGNEWTPGAEAEVYDPTATGGGLDETAVQALIDASVSALLDGAPGALDTLNELAAAINDDASFAASITTALAGKASTTHNHDATYQPLDADLAAIAALTTAPFGRGLLEMASLTAVRAALGFGTAKVATDVSSNVSPSGTTLVDTTGLSFTVANGTHYVFRAVLWITGDAAADIDVAVTAPTGTLFATASGLSNAASSAPNAPNTNTVTTSGARITGFGALTAGTVAIVVEGTFTAGANGTVQIQHSQRTTNATATVVKAGSTLTYFTA